MLVDWEGEGGVLTIFEQISIGSESCKRFSDGSNCTSHYWPSPREAIGNPVTLLRDCTHSAQRMKINSNMAALPFVGTLDSDDDVEQFDNETDSEDESEKVYNNSCLRQYHFYFHLGSSWIFSQSRRPRQRRKGSRCSMIAFSSFRETLKIFLRILGTLTLLSTLQRESKLRWVNSLKDCVLYYQLNGFQHCRFSWRIWHVVAKKIQRTEIYALMTNREV